MDQIEEYWKTMKPTSDLFHSPNVSLFRLIGSAFGSLKNKNVLEIGFGYGADLLECYRRGAEVYGLDLNDRFVALLKNRLYDRVDVYRAGQDSIKFNVKFDLIYFRDLIYYLSDIEIKEFLLSLKNSLSSDGLIIFQFIEKDFKINDYNPYLNFDLSSMINYEETNIFPQENPIRFLETSAIYNTLLEINYDIIGTKRMIQSYDHFESIYRVDKYFVIKPSI